jgi:outer membrane protein assembly factor BamE
MNKVFYIFFAFLTLTGCQSYQADLQQGAEITNQQVSLLKPNLSKEEVTQVLGSPTLVPIVDKSTWHYTYWTLPGNKRSNDPHYKSLTLHFNNKNRLVSFEGNWDIKNLPKKHS